jgi:hypothetical protein
MIRASVIAACILLLAACDSTGPGLALHGTYDLQSHGGLDLPLDLSWTDHSGHLNAWHLLAGEMELLEHGRYRELAVYLSPGDTLRFVSAGRFVVERGASDHRVTLTRGTSSYTCGVRLDAMSCDVAGVEHLYRMR